MKLLVFFIYSVRVMDYISSFTVVCIFILKPTKYVDSEKDHLLDEEEEQRQEEIRVKLERKRFKQDQKLVSTTLRSGNTILKVLLMLSTGIR